MKKKIIIAVAALMLFAFSIAVYAYKNSTSHHSKTSCCSMENCCQDGECKMNHECCKKDKDSCPMKSGNEDCPMHK
jgi:hypothetical protein